MAGTVLLVLVGRNQVCLPLTAALLPGYILASTAQTPSRATYLFLWNLGKIPVDSPLPQVLRELQSLPEDPADDSKDKNCVSKPKMRACAYDHKATV